ncbi:hypothetical protein DRV85_10685 [Rhodosalinus halophilus]|uniref:Uncharacterized protein n=1 Tax=Rhodosalinus halophilus TaxID=2259333 RepID=A0A365U8N7_9RHOB|nr:hypothetical protein DRV85_10685 [Rhodosalinus halophilus]
MPGQEDGGAPLSAIEWLERQAAGAVPLRPDPAEPPVANTADVPEVSVRPLETGPMADAVGLLPPSVTGFPQTLWQESRAAELARRVAAQRVEGQPAMQALLYSLLLAEALPPADAGREARLLQARLDKLAELGAVEPAEALIARAGPETPALFARWFDLSLLLGDTSEACTAMRADMHLSERLGPRVFCLARAGNWAEAAMVLDTARAIGAIEEPVGDLLARFLDPEAASGPELAPSRDPTALEFRLREAIGAPLPTSALPLRFAVTALGGDAGWRAEIEAAERLARHGAISENRLLGIYTQRAPAASGGVWDRVAAVQRLDAALARGDAGAPGRALVEVWPLMRAAGLEVPLARLFGAELAALGLDGKAGEIAFEAALLSPDYERLARELPAETPQARFLAALAAGTPGRAEAPDARAEAIAEGFAAAPPPELARMIEADRLGEAILRGMELYASGRAGDLPDLAAALATFRTVGLEDTARRAGIEAMLLGRGR